MIRYLSKAYKVSIGLSELSLGEREEDFVDFESLCSSTSMGPSYLSRRERDFAACWLSFFNHLSPIDLSRKSSLGGLIFPFFPS